MEQWSKNIDFAALGKQFGTPLYVFNPQQLKRNVAAYLKLVGEAARIAYPVKANPSLAVLQELNKLGCGADCASNAEVNLAQQAGITIDRIIYNTPCPDLDLALFLLKNKGKVVIDSLEFLYELAEEINSESFSGDVLIRINPAINLSAQQSTEAQKILAHGSSQAKFGIAAEDLLLLKELPLKIRGLHMHAGSRINNLENFAVMIQYLHEIAQKLQYKGQKIEIINIGGGLGIPYTEEDFFPDISALAERLSPLMHKHKIYMVEPGNSLIGNTMGLITKIRQLKQIRGKRWGIIDVGCDQLINQIALRTPHQILNQEHRPLSNNGSDSLGGPLCFAGDVILERTDLANLKKGDTVFIQHTGAYCFALSNHFNGRFYQGMVRLEEDNRITWAHCPEKEYNDINNSTYCPDFTSLSKTADFHVWNENISVSENDTGNLIHLIESYLLESLKKIIARPSLTLAIDFAQVDFSQRNSPVKLELHLHCAMSFMIRNQRNQEFIHVRISESLLGLRAHWLIKIQENP
ncbi:MAG TPA: hypothetical protein PK657_00020 [Legionella sp.]|nr:hypothetical protein [Legionella sp.]